MEQAMDRLLAVLDKLRETYETLYRVSEGMKRAVIEDDAPALSAHTEEQGDLFGQIEKLERERADVVGALADRLGQPAEALTVTELTKYANRAQAAHLLAARSGIQEIAARQSKINEEIKALIGMHLEYMEFMLDSFAREPQLNSIYGNTGIVQEDEANSMINSEV